ncbi:MAG TPA: helix-turn-helix transcriptional regulator [Arsenophonus nasoniae]|uniref:helix-turn-helix transcriptional regulator n=1 Tax=Arsenophonus nasoniae TaxID=638 RepID=UPI003879C562
MKMIKIMTKEELESMVEIDRMIREEECKWLTTLSNDCRYQREKKNLFLKRIKLSPQIVAYRLSEVQAWVKGTWKPE